MAYLKLKQEHNVTKVRFDSENDSGYATDIIKKFLELYEKAGWVNTLTIVLNPETEDAQVFTTGDLIKRRPYYGGDYEA